MTAATTLRIGTRESRLALVQASLAAEALAPSVGEIAIVGITTRGDEISARQARGSWIATDGQFTRELEQALLEGHVDLVVHSYKDLPTEPIDGLTIGAVLERADPRDCLLTADGGGLDELPFGARIGTSSPRRAAQLAASRSDLIAMPIRGNVDTRMRRLRAGAYDGIILAAAGLDRLGIAVPDAARLPLELMLPAPAQGALALQVRTDDTMLRQVLAIVDHRPTRIAVEAERRLLRRLGGGCLAPLGALGEVDGERLRLRAAYEAPNGAYVRAEASGDANDAEAVIDEVANAIASVLAAA
jgi:hydroxymethylbilane synthase